MTSNFETQIDLDVLNLLRREFWVGRFIFRVSFLTRGPTKGGGKARVMVSHLSWTSGITAASKMVPVCLTWTTLDVFYWRLKNQEYHANESYPMCPPDQGEFITAG